MLIDNYLMTIEKNFREKKIQSAFQLINDLKTKYPKTTRINEFFKKNNLKYVKKMKISSNEIEDLYSKKNSQEIKTIVSNFLKKEPENAYVYSFLRHYYGAEQVWWLGDGIEGDDTDGHIDDMTRFVSPSTIVSVLEDNSSDVNYKPLLENWELLQDFRFKDGSTPEIIALPMPAPVYYDGQRLPASYANFYITNHSVLVPIFSDDNDSKALGILQELFPTRKVVGIESTDLIWGLGAFHCLSQQIPKAP